MQRGNISALNSEGGGKRAYLLRRSRPTSRSANNVIDRRRRQIHSSNPPFLRVLAADPASEHVRCLQALPVVQAQLAFGNHAHGMHHALGDAPFVHVHQGRQRPARQASHLEGVHNPVLDEAARFVEALNPSFQHVSLPHGEGPVSVSTIFHRGSLDLSQSSRYAQPLMFNIQPYETPQSQLTPPAQAQKDAPASSAISRWSPGNSNSPGDAANRLQVVLYGEADPEKSWKRRDNSEDKQRKEEISKEQGACLKCKKAKKQCNGGKVCDRCDKGGVDCIRTCNSCWSNKKPACDEGISCNNCKLAGTNCVRPSATNTRTEDVHQCDLTSVHSQVTRTTSSTQVNNHTMFVIERQIETPTAWGVRFDVIPPPPNTDEIDVMDPTSDSALPWCQLYSQQSTDGGLRPTLTKSSGTKVASEGSSLQVLGKELVAFDVRSEATDSTSHFAEAIHFSDQGSPQVEDFDPDPWSTQEEARL